MKKCPGNTFSKNRNAKKPRNAKPKVWRKMLQYKPIAAPCNTGSVASAQHNFGVILHKFGVSTA